MIDNFKVSFQIQCISNQPVICKVILREKIVFYLKETVHVRMNYIGLLKGRSFIIITIYLTVFNTFLDTNTLYIVIIVNLTNKILTLSKDMCLSLIYEYIDILYIIIDMAKTFIAVVTAFIAVFELFITIQKITMFGS